MSQIYTGIVKKKNMFSLIQLGIVKKKNMFSLIQLDIYFKTDLVIKFTTMALHINIMEIQN